MPPTTYRWIIVAAGGLLGCVAIGALFSLPVLATGPVLGGVLFDRLGTYTWLYVASCAIGLGAFAVALTFKRVTNQQPATSHSN